MELKIKKSNLNFRVYTAATTPTSGIENDIAVITSTPMKNWIMSPDTPSGAPRTDGDVWIQYAVNGDTFNGLKNGTMLISVVKAYQYKSGAWETVDFVAYQDGGWSTRWDGTLYESGDEYNTVTGGWTVIPKKWNDSWSDTDVGTIAISKNDNSISATLTAATSGYACGILCPVNDIDLTGKTAIKARAKTSIVTGTTFAWLMVFDRENEFILTPVANIELGTEMEEVTLQLPELSGKYAVGFAFRLLNDVTATLECEMVKVI